MSPKLEDLTLYDGGEKHFKEYKLMNIIFAPTNDVHPFTKYEFTHCHFENCRIDISLDGNIRFDFCTFKNCCFEAKNSLFLFSRCNFSNVSTTVRIVDFTLSSVVSSFFDVEWFSSNNSRFTGVNFSSGKVYGTVSYSCFSNIVCLNGSELPFIKVYPGCLFSDCAHLFPKAPCICPVEGPFVAYKILADGAIATLLIPADAKRTGYSGRKCRASKAFVLAIEDSRGNHIKEATNNYHTNLITYTVGEMVYPDAYDDSREKTCTNGIHFFMTKEEAKNYVD